MLSHRCLPWSLVLVLWIAASASAGERIDPNTAKAEQGIRWYDIRTLGVEGQGWTAVKSPFDRLPAKAEGKVRDAVWNLSRNSAGLCVRFVTDATALHARWTLVSDRLDMPHMPATSVSGLDLYTKTDDGRWHWLAVGRATQFPKNSVQLVTGVEPGTREYLLYLPLYNSVTSVEIGLPEGTTLSKAEAYPDGHRKPIVFYGTSITHGACATRCGMVHTAILGRRLNYPIINLGFSGNGRMEPEVTRLIAEIDAACYVIDCLPNMQAPDVTARTEPLVRILREARPDTPIVLVEDRFYEDGFLIKSKRERNETNHAALQKAFESLTKAGVKNLHYIPAENLLGHDGEATVDSSHPNDLGFMRQADEFQKVLEAALR